ncbi:MAG: Crp/Fnr family transcriptional regulator [Candidatus Koribacter versatilis]|uniref:Crp/Fnr family transcriptional regulator n=1 Tax=Candidatus Korobacter versatilis TaxID=658062 RepID=A0A932ERN7_9BACT|nr:Crp/Fnr family transcriptional regulator [Candidatus Koribacter versatilis]
MPEKGVSEVLARAPLFANLSEGEMAFLVRRAVSRQYKAGEAIFGEGEPCQGLYVVESGRIKVFKMSAGGREQVLAIDGPGASVAELPVFDDGAYPASATAITDARLVFVSKQDFRALCLEHPEVALRVVKIVGGRLRRLVGIIEELSFTTVRHRMAALLLNLAKRSGTKTARGVEFTLPATQQDIAGMIGTVRELVSRNLSRLQAEEIVAVEGRTVVVPDLARLEAELESSE